MISSRQRLLWAGLLASAAFAATAQTTPPPAPAAGAPTAQHQPGPRAERGDPAKRFEQMQERRAKRLAALKEKLKLNASQENAWSSFAAAQQPPAPPAQRMQRGDFAKMTTPQRLDFMQQRQAERAARFAKRADATRSFYAALAPEQQQTFDAETARFGRGGPHEHWHRDGQHPQPPAKG
ncbi:Spy/CpxP family protein refolding chaperone [Variovorax sp. J22R133]|uniref:Spy/CpxP family protein refolding chaperone n=1 Tax=Variovorax brevis TaxID=3053503 RepID=UPI002574A1CE|nr:Spy/CpxP family protein refolding chaperone [Variovorax sp. J22R133]MDM0111727.1 Spy/CpxP family protein refolding chaperone [Variovorax sp. J22R133]